MEGGARWRYGEWREGQDGGMGSEGRGKMEVRGVEGGARWRYGEWREGQDGGIADCVSCD